jgi:D-proline reductase (dithiol) PrdB
MVRLRDLSDAEREHIMTKELPVYEDEPWVEGPPLAERRVALVTTAGLHRRADDAFSFVDLSYRVIPADTDLDGLTMTHSSVHFDRTGFREDVNTVFPLDRLRELAADGVIGSIADHHYSLMGAGWPPEMIEPTCTELARLLHADEVTAVCLVPV